MRHFAKLAAFAIAFTLGAGSGAAQQQTQVETTKKATHGSWEVHCAVNDEKLCFMSQVANGQNGKPLVNVRIQKTPNLKTPKGDAVPAVIQIQAPLGVLLTAGLSLQIDSAKPGLAPYKFCTPQNCVVEEPIAPDLIDRMKKGSNAKMSVISAISGDKGEADVSLSGFTKAFNSL